MTIPCSAGSLAVGEPLAATAPTARAWILIEQPGPWGRQALLDSHLDAELGQVLARRAADAGVTILLVRHGGRPERSWNPADRRAWVALTAPGGMRLREGILPDPGQVLDWDLAAVATGHLPAFGRRTDEPLLLVCTHSGRDACCAVHGRALMASLPASERIWECSHLGGHRFAPTALSLPDGYAYGRLDAIAAQALGGAAERGRMRLEDARGRTCLPAPLQAADLAVRTLIDETSADALDVLRILGDRAVPAPANTRIDDEAVRCEVRHRDGRAWTVDVLRDATGAVRIESCLGEPHAVITWTAAAIGEAPDWRHDGPVHAR